MTIGDAPDAVPLQPGPGDIRFENVSFEYPDDHNKVLHNVSLDIRPGERLALVGPSGGGKTTPVQPHPPLLRSDQRPHPDRWAGHPPCHPESLRQDIGIVQQDVYLFSGTVAQNIAYGKPGATREEIMEAARLAGAEKFILALKDGFDTYVGERGVKLSGGQKQRIAIARVFLKNPPILILDTPPPRPQRGGRTGGGGRGGGAAGPGPPPPPPPPPPRPPTRTTTASLCWAKRASWNPAPTTSCWQSRASTTACGISCRGMKRCKKTHAYKKALPQARQSFLRTEGSFTHDQAHRTIDTGIVAEDGGHDGGLTAGLEGIDLEVLPAAGQTEPRLRGTRRRPP